MLKQGVWYEISTRVNNREPLFRGGRTLALFDRVFRETAHRFAFAVRSLSLAGDRLAFSIRPADGFELPAIMDLFDNPGGIIRPANRGSRQFLPKPNRPRGIPLP
jgi:hypothetical protein